MTVLRFFTVIGALIWVGLLLTASMYGMLVETTNPPIGIYAP